LLLFEYVIYLIMYCCFSSRSGYCMIKNHYDVSLTWLLTGQTKKGIFYEERSLIIQFLNHTFHMYSYWWLNKCRNILFRNLYSLLFGYLEYHAYCWCIDEAKLISNYMWLIWPFHCPLLLLIIPFLYFDVQVPITGLKTQFRGRYVRDLAENIVKLAKVAQIQYHIVEHIHIHGSHKSRNISGNSLLHALSMQDGLQRRGHMEVGFLNEVDEIVRTGTSILLSYIDLLKHRAILCVPKLNFHAPPPFVPRSDTSREACRTVHDKVAGQCWSGFSWVHVLIFCGII
jgi:hypothetical protein